MDDTCTIGPLTVQSPHKHTTKVYDGQYMHSPEKNGTIKSAPPIGTTFYSFIYFPKNPHSSSVEVPSYDETSCASFTEVRFESGLLDKCKLKFWPVWLGFNNLQMNSNHLQNIVRHTPICLFHLLMLFIYHPLSTAVLAFCSQINRSFNTIPAKTQKNALDMAPKEIRSMSWKRGRQLLGARGNQKRASMAHQ